MDPTTDPKAPTPALEDPGDATAASFLIEPRRVSSDRVSGMMPAEGVFVAPTSPALAVPSAVPAAEEEENRLEPVGKFSGAFSLSPGTAKLQSS